MSTPPAEPIRITVERPPQPKYEPYRCIALADPADPKTHCLAAARLYPCGWRCETHRP